ncbi:MAG: WG repeat-containing protein, partial [Proteobacteria bacterium]|nr:WG repeat-containing protein [Pseudomonadota bacterium]
PEGPLSKFSGGLAPAKIGEKCGYVDRKGNLVIQPRFLNARNFSEGLAAVEVCSGWGYIDRSGKLVWQTIIPCDRWGEPLEK